MINELISQLMNQKGVCKTALATQGLLNMSKTVNKSKNLTTFNKKTEVQ